MKKIFSAVFLSFFILSVFISCEYNAAIYEETKNKLSQITTVSSMPDFDSSYTWIETDKETATELWEKSLTSKIHEGYTEIYVAENTSDGSSPEIKFSSYAFIDCYENTCYDVSDEYIYVVSFYGEYSLPLNSKNPSVVSDSGKIFYTEENEKVFKIEDSDEKCIYENGWLIQFKNSRYQSFVVEYHD